MSETRNVRPMILAALRDNGGWWITVEAGQGHDGLPDIIGCKDGRFFAFEVKDPKANRKLERLQALTLREIAEEGKGVAAKVGDPQQAVYLVNNARAKGG